MGDGIRRLSSANGWDGAGRRCLWVGGLRQGHADILTNAAHE